MIFYYQPIVEKITKNAFVAKTKFWGKDKPVKIELNQSGKTSEEALLKLYAFFESGECREMPCNYFLCSKSVVDIFKPIEVSKPFLSGYTCDSEPYYVAWLNFEEVENYYKANIEGTESDLDFMVREIVPGTMDVSNICLKSAKKIGLFVEMENITGLTTEKNRAMMICNLALRYCLTPVQLINKIAK